MKNFWSILLIWLVVSVPAPAAVTVSSQLVPGGDINEKIPFSGEVRPVAEAFVTPDKAGRVEKVLVEIGQPVKSGDILITLDGDRQALSVRLAEIGLKIAKQKVIELQKDYQRKKFLYEKKVLNDKAYDESESNYLNSENYVHQAQLQLEQEKLDLSHGNLRAPMTGIFVNRNVQPGQGVTPGIPLGRVIDLTKVYIEAKIPEHQINRVRLGQSCLLESGLSGKVAFTNLYGDEARSFLVKILCENPRQDLKANMFTKGEILVEQYQNVPLIPVSSLLIEGTRTFVYLVQNGKAVKRPVEILAREAGRCFARGLEIGDQLITEGMANLEDGAEVNVISRGENEKISVPVGSAPASTASLPSDLH